MSAPMTPADREKMREAAQKAQEAARVAYGINGAWQVLGSYIFHPNDDDDLPAHAAGELPAEREHIATSCPANVLALLDFADTETARADRLERAMEMQARAFALASSKHDEALAAEKERADRAEERCRQLEASWKRHFEAAQVAEAALSAVRGHAGELAGALEQIRQLDKIEKRTCVDFDPAGCTYAVEMVDGLCAAVAARVLAAYRARTSPADNTGANAGPCSRPAITTAAPANITEEEKAAGAGAMEVGYCDDCGITHEAVIHVRRAREAERDGGSDV